MYYGVPPLPVMQSFSVSHFCGMVSHSSQLNWSTAASIYIILKGHLAPILCVADINVCCLHSNKPFFIFICICPSLIHTQTQGVVQANVGQKVTFLTPP